MPSNDFEPTPAQKEALDAARHLAESGVPLFLAKPDRRAKTGFRHPDAWEQTQPDPTAAVVDAWRPGMALCALMGVVVDGLDVDPRNGGDASVAQIALPRSYGRAQTPSGGTHDLIASLGVRSRDGLLPGVDLKAGHRGDGHGLLYIAPTERVSKTTGEVTAYHWLTPPNLDELVIIGGDDSGGPLKKRVLAALRGGDGTDVPAYDGPDYEDLPDRCKEIADGEVARVVGWWREYLATAAEWDDGQRDAYGRGWEALARDWAWALARLTAAPWTALDENRATELHKEVLPHVIAVDPVCRDKWGNRLLAKAAKEPADQPPWTRDFEPNEPTSRSVDVTSESETFAWLRTEVGQRGLAGLFRRGRELVYTPRIGEDGYIPPEDDRESDGVAQVHIVSALGLAARIDCEYDVFWRTKRGALPRLFPREPAARVLAVADKLPNLRPLGSVTHTPTLRADGSVIDTPGYDSASGVLYLPARGLVVPPIPDRPTREQAKAARALITTMIGDFPWVSPHHKANYLGALFTPLLRLVVPPPYKLVLITAPQRGSGKGYLAMTLTEVHGGVFKPEFPSSQEEFTKVMVSVLDGTTAPVVQLDNLSGTLRSSVLDAVLTKAQISERVLGSNRMADMVNDRLWVGTGNNVKIGGDLARRTLWVEIDARMPHPELRKPSDFAIGDLKGWIAENRGEVLAALLTILRGWAVAGMPRPEPDSTDDYGAWIATVRGVLGWADFGDTVGTFSHTDAARAEDDEDETEWAAFLRAARRVFGEDRWSANDLLWQSRQGDNPEDDDGAKFVLYDELPGDIADKRQDPRKSAGRSLGRWLARRERTWAGGLAVVSSGSDRNGVKLWQVISATQTPRPEG